MIARLGFRAPVVERPARRHYWRLLGPEFSRAKGEEESLS